jgi:hypothetical protein
VATVEEWQRTCYGGTPHWWTTAATSSSSNARRDGEGGEEEKHGGGLASGEAGSGHHASGAPSTPSPVGVRTWHHPSTAVWWWWLTVWCGRRPGWGWRRCCFFFGKWSPCVFLAHSEFLMEKVVAVCPIDELFLQCSSLYFMSLCVSNYSWRKWSPCAQ